MISFKSFKKKKKKKAKSKFDYWVSGVTLNVGRPNAGEIEYKVETTASGTYVTDFNITSAWDKQMEPLSKDEIEIARRYFINNPTKLEQAIKNATPSGALESSHKL